MKNSEVRKPKEVLERVFLNSNQIITLNDFPVHSEKALKAYVEMDKKGLKMPPVLVVRKSVLEPFLAEEIFNPFVDSHPEAEYFIMDGSHRTTTDCLNGNQIQAVIIESNDDIELAFKEVENGEIFGLPINGSFEKCIHDLANHFGDKPYFQTVLEKTEKMVKEKVLPDYIIKDYLKRKIK